MIIILGGDVLGGGLRNISEPRSEVAMLYSSQIREE